MLRFTLVGELKSRGVRCAMAACSLQPAACSLKPEACNLQPQVRCAMAACGEEFTVVLSDRQLVWAFGLGDVGLRP